MSHTDKANLSVLHKDILWRSAHYPSGIEVLYIALDAIHNAAQFEGVELDEDGVPCDDEFEPKPYPHSPQDIRIALYELEFLGLMWVDKAIGVWYVTDQGRQEAT